MEWREATHVTATSATINVSINPEGGESKYEISLECQNPREGAQTCEPLTVDPQLHQGTIPAGSEAEIVTDEVNGLQPNYVYRYSVIASNPDGRNGFVGAGFITCPSEGTCSPQPYMPGMSLWVIEGAENSAKEAPQREAEREARKREEEERPVKEAEERAARERELREEGERAVLARSSKCVVPHLRGDSLAKASHALGRAHCRLGTVHELHGNRGHLVVVRQSVPGGKKLARGAKVSITLKPVAGTS